MENHKNYCIHAPEFQGLLRLLQDFDNIQETDGFLVSSTFNFVTGFIPAFQLGPVKEWHDSINPHLRKYLCNKM